MTRRRKQQRHQPTNSTTPVEKDDKNSKDNLSSGLLERLPDETKIAIVEAASFDGPLPPPSLYGQYEEVRPGSAERLMVLAENEQAHRHKWEMAALKAQISDVRRGQWMGFGLGIFGLIVAALSAYFEQPVVGAASIFAVIAGIAAAILKGRSNTGHDD